MSTFISKNTAISLGRRLRKVPPVLLPMTGWLKDEKEEAFCVLLCDGLTLAVAYQRAGFAAADHAVSAFDLIQSPRIKARCQAIFEARKNTPGLGLGDVTDMLKRVYAGALQGEEYNAAHNAAFSLARLYGLIVDRAQLDVIRRPSREPDAPAELALGAWVQSLPGLPLQSSQPLEGPLPGAPAGPLGGPILEGSRHGSDLDGPPGLKPSMHADVHSLGPAAPAPRGVEIENGAPVGPVTGTPTPRAHSGLLDEIDEGTGTSGGFEGTGIFPRAEDLF
jgi:hypothetical protein